MRYIKRNARSLMSVWATCLLAACGGPLTGGNDNDENPNETPTPASLTAPLAAEHFNDAVIVALESDTAIALSTDEFVTLDGDVTLSDALVSFDGMQITKAPLSFTGDAVVTALGTSANISFSADVHGTVTIDGVQSTLEGNFPLHEDFAMASAMFAMGPWLSIGFPAAQADCSNLTVTDNGNGSVTLDGDCTVGNIVVDFDMVTIDPGPPLDIDGTITIDDGNGNEVVIDFNGTTATIFVNGQEVATVQIS